MIFYVSLLLSLAVTLDAACPEIVNRAEWGARNGMSRALAVPVRHVFIHHTSGATCNSRDTCSKVVRQTQNYFIDSKKWADIGYNFLVGGDGRIYEGRGWKVVGAHTYGYNSDSIGIAFTGYFEKEKPSAAMMDAAKELIECGVENNFISANYQIHGHRDAKCTSCPGEALYNIIEFWPRFVRGKLPEFNC